MGPLTLCQLSTPAGETPVAYAYLFYRQGIKMVDHTGHNIHEAMTRAVKAAFEMHLVDIIVPLLNNDLINSNYQAAYVDYCKQSPWPFIAIARRDGELITADDQRAIETTLHHIIVAYNKTQMPSKFFSKTVQHDLLALKEAAMPQRYPKRPKIK